MSEPFLGQIMMVGFSFPPRGWAFCSGQLVQIASNSALFSLLGTTFGGDGRNTFGLPDLQGRTPIHPGQGPGLPDYDWGDFGGAASRTLTDNNLPHHTHTATLNATTDEGDSNDPSMRMLANTEEPARPYRTPGGPTHQMAPSAISVGSAGASQAINMMPPYLGIYHCIALQGIYPSRV